jgi:quinol monooxygenase YgiN
MLVREGCEPEFEHAWRASAEHIALLPGNLDQVLMTDESQPRLYVIASDWESRGALRSFEGSVNLLQLSATLDPLREFASKDVLNVLHNIKGGNAAS